MENPNSWTEVEKVIVKAMQEHEEALASLVCGHSLPMTIANALQAAGLIKEGK